MLAAVPAAQDPDQVRAVPPLGVDEYCEKQSLSWANGVSSKAYGRKTGWREGETYLERCRHSRSHCMLTMSTRPAGCDEDDEEAAQSAVACPRLEPSMTWMPC